MSKVKFEYHPVTTMTLVFKMRGVIDIPTIYPLLPITRIDLRNPYSRQNNVKNFKITHVSSPGSILSARLGDNTRGIISSSTTEAFKNSITVVVSTKLKNLNLKISKQTIHMTGVKSFDNGKEAVNHLINHVYDIDRVLREMYRNQEERDNAIEWVITNTRGEARLLESKEDGIIIENEIKLLDVNTIDYTGLNEKFVKFCINYAIDFKDKDFNIDGSTENDRHSVYSMFLGLIKNRRSCIIEDPYYIEKMEIGTININYSLGFLVDRRKLATLINNHEGFYGRYYNSIENKATIQLDCPELPPRGSKKKRPMHSILVYRSGAVTQSGPRPDLMKRAYYKFNDFITKYRSMVEITDDEEPIVNIKFNPIRMGHKIEPTEDLKIEGPIVVSSVYREIPFELRDISDDSSTQDPLGEINKFEIPECQSIDMCKMGSSTSEIPPKEVRSQSKIRNSLDPKGLRMGSIPLASLEGCRMGNPSSEATSSLKQSYSLGEMRKLMMNKEEHLGGTC